MTSINIGRSPTVSASDFATFIKFIVALQDPVQREDLTNAIIAEANTQSAKIAREQALLDEDRAKLVMELDSNRRGLDQERNTLIKAQQEERALVETHLEMVANKWRDFEAEVAAFKKRVDMEDNRLLSRERICQEREADSSLKQIKLDKLLAEVEAERQRIAARIAQLEAAGVMVNV